MSATRRYNRQFDTTRIPDRDFAVKQSDEADSRRHGDSLWSLTSRSSNSYALAHCDLALNTLSAVNSLKVADTAVRSRQGVTDLNQLTSKLDSTPIYFGNAANGSSSAGQSVSKYEWCDLVTISHIEVRAS